MASPRAQGTPYFRTSPPELMYEYFVAIAQKIFCPPLEKVLRTPMPASVNGTLN